VRISEKPDRFYQRERPDRNPNIKRFICSKKITVCGLHPPYKTLTLPLQNFNYP